MTIEIHSIKRYSNFSKTVFFVKYIGKILPTNGYATLMQPEQPKTLANEVKPLKMVRLYAY